MRAILCEVGKNSKVIEHNNTLEEYQNYVGGWIEFYYCEELLDNNINVAIICNEEGKLLDLPPNRAIFYGLDIVEIINGDFVVVGIDQYNTIVDVPSYNLDFLLKYFDTSKIFNASV